MIACFIQKNSVRLAYFYTESMNFSPLFSSVSIDADHAGASLAWTLMDFCHQKDWPCEVGELTEQSVNYTDHVHFVVQCVRKKALGVLICGSGIGMSIAANRYSGIRAALCHNTALAQLARQHNDANILVIGARFTEPPQACSMLEHFLTTPFEGGRHQKRIEMIERNFRDLSC